MDVWVQAHNIPVECYYSDLANLLGLAAGHLLQVDWSDDRTRILDFFRFKVRIHTNEPLVPGAFIELLEGDFHWISFRYEKIFRICYKCGKIGHTNTACKSSLMEAFESLHQRYDHPSFSQSFPLILANNKPMFTSSLRAFRNTDCNRTICIWVLYEEEVQRMEMDQNLIFDVDSSDSLSSGDVFHTPDGGSSPIVDPNPHPTPVEEGDPPPAQGSSFWGNIVNSIFSPLSPSLVNPRTPLPVSAPITSPLLVDESMRTDQNLIIESTDPTSLHVATSSISPQILTSSSVPTLEEAQSSPIHPFNPHAISTPETKAKNSHLLFAINVDPSQSPTSQTLTTPEPNLKLSSITENPTAMKIIVYIWNMPLPGSPLFRVVNHNKIMIKVLKLWARERKDSIPVKIKMIQTQLGSVLESLSPANIHLEKSLRKELDSLLAQEELFWAQRAKQHWLALGDSNTKFFLSMTKARRARNHVWQLTSSFGDVLIDESNIRNEFHQHFKSFYSSAPFFPLDSLQSFVPYSTLSDSQLASLNLPFQA
ncbi:hypothetical protein RHSIM_RhsimUnG0069600 [Rhododendron simsii]|uniref:CCHC-type domain-containing protein n=1 Tax=Rhododendron simsii TaxID=118357 RepID=A0A834L2T0_RHOSS|nr:hypothetical protein RHSIM_RhsimUnG0069600 [Rhododendron simsii]